MKLHAPLLPIVLCLLAGIFLCDLLPVWQTGLALLAVAVVVMCLLRHFPRWQTGAIWVAVFLFGMTLGKMDAENQQPDWSPDWQRLSVVVVSEPMVKERFVVMDVLTAEGHRKIRCHIQRDEDSETIGIGQGLELWTKVKRWRREDATWVYAGNWDWQTLSLHGLSVMERVRLKMLLVRHSLLVRYREWGISERAYGVVAAMTLGDRSQLDRHLKEIYSKVGASHVLALSGLHLMTVYAFVTLLVGWWRWPLVTQTLTVLAMWAFALLVGLPASVVRAASMISLYAVLALGHREKMSVNTLAFVALVMMVLQPSIVYDIGFQLSFVAVLAIVLFYPLSLRLVPPDVLQRHRWLSFIWSLTFVSLAAQMGTAPLVAFYFGRFSTCFLLSNYVAIPLATVVLYLTLGVVLTGWVSPLQRVLVMALSFVVELMNHLFEKLSLLSWSSIEDIHLNVWQVLLIYVVLACGYVLLSLYIPVTRRNV